MKKLILIAIFALISISLVSAQESIVDYSENSIPILNEELRKLNKGVVLPSGAIFFMITGSCPLGTTDVSTTYANKFVKINATQGTSTNAVLTGTTDSHTLTVAEMPVHDHSGTFGRYVDGSPYPCAAYGQPDVNPLTSSVPTQGGGSGHNHTISTATTLAPSAITCKACLVN